MRRLTVREVQMLANRRGVRKEAFEEFLCFMPHDYPTAIACAYVDSELYQWNSDTLQAIFEGIELACDNQLIVMG